MVLFDVNVLIALADPEHTHFDRARGMFGGATRDGWATCPVTQNGFLRILGHPQYPKGPGSPEKARRLLVALTSMPGHQFWPDNLSLLDPKAFPHLPASKNLTDFYLLALAIQNGARLVTFDCRMDLTLLKEGANSYFVLC